MNTTHPTLILLLALAGLLPAHPLRAGSVPDRLSYQGSVTDASGNAIGNTTPVNRKVQFRIYDASSGGTALYAEEQTATISGGEFSVAIGNGAGVAGSPGPSAPANTPYTAISTVVGTPDKSYYLGVTVDDGDGNISNDREIAPRQQILSGAFALRALRAESVDSSAVDSSMLKDDSVQAADLGSSSVTSVKIQDAAVTSVKIADGSISTADIGNATVTKDKINTASIGLWDVNGSNVYRSAGNVGIGTAAPGYPLEISNAATSELALRGQASAQTRLDDIGDASTYWIQTNSDRLYFLWNGGAGAATWQPDYPFVLKNSFTGLGTADPATRLHVMGEGTIEDSSVPNLRLKYTNGNGTQLAVASATGLFSSDAARGDGVLRSLDGGLRLVSGNGVSALAVRTDNWVEINRGLQFSRKADTAALGNDNARIYFDYTNGDINDGYLMIQTNDDNNEEILFAQGGNERMRIADNGSVQVWGYNGLGALNVGGRAGQTYYQQSFLNHGGAGNSDGQRTNTVSIHASNMILCDVEVQITSDARVKQPLGISDSKRDLELLDALQITDYTYRDTVQHGTAAEKKVIAQQVEAVLPQAVDKHKGTVPDIYRPAVSDNGWVRIPTDLAKGERVKILHGDKEEILEVLETAPGAFRVGLASSVRDIFVYGREVDDLRSVDYDAIAMLNVSATQELHRKLQTLEKRLEALEKRLGGE